MTAEHWVNILQNFGLAVVILFFVGWGLVKVGRWIAPHIEKIFARLLKGIDDAFSVVDRVDDLETKVETLWEFQLRRANVEALHKHVAAPANTVANVRIAEEAKTWLKEFAVELQAFYRQSGRTLSETQLAVEIERRWGRQIVDKICIPHGLSQGTCLLIAMEVAREGDMEPLPPPLPPVTS